MLLFVFFYFRYHNVFSVVFLLLFCAATFLAAYLVVPIQSHTLTHIDTYKRSLAASIMNYVAFDISFTNTI